MADDWQPIDTAPRDGRRVLISDGKEVTGAAWVNVREQNLTGSGRRDRWLCDSETDSFPGAGPVIEAPTHWQPMPAPPMR